MSINIYYIPYIIYYYQHTFIYYYRYITIYYITTTNTTYVNLTNILICYSSIYHFDPANLPEPSNHPQPPSRRQKKMNRQQSLCAPDDFQEICDLKQSLYTDNFNTSILFYLEYKRNNYFHTVRY